LEIEHERQAIIDRTQIVVSEVGHVLAKVAGVNGADHLAQDLGAR
jgi:hypothetical protein